MPELGQVGRRLLVAFIAVTLAAVLMVTVAALIGSQRGIAASSARQQVTEDVAVMAGQAYAVTGDWATADLEATRAFAESEGLRLQIFNAAGQPLLAGGPGIGGGYQQPVIVAGEQVGSVRAGFGGSPAQTGQGIAWRWILSATAAALVVAVMASWWAAGWITSPIDKLTQAAAAFAAGDRTSRAAIEAPGEIGELARTFDEAADTITRQEQLRRNLSADVSHELRTPLTALMAGLEEVRDGYVPADEQTLTRLHDQATKLQRVVTDLASLADAEAAMPQADVRQVDLTQVVVTSAAGHAAPLRVAGVSLVVGAAEPVAATADPARVDQIVGNLLSNAARYCHSGDTVTVQTVSEGDRAVLEVTDTGPGVAQADLEHLFERFWRGSSGVVGSGIGLAIVRELARSQGGTVEALSDGMSGLTVRVSFPG